MRRQKMGLLVPLDVFSFTLNREELSNFDDNVILPKYFHNLFQQLSELNDSFSQCILNRTVLFLYFDFCFFSILISPTIDLYYMVLQHFSELHWLFSCYLILNSQQCEDLDYTIFCMKAQSDVCTEMTPLQNLFFVLQNMILSALNNCQPGKHTCYFLISLPQLM